MAAPFHRAEGWVFVSWIQDDQFQGAVPVLHNTNAFGQLQLTPEEGFVLSRVDGHSTVTEICLITGLSRDQTLDTLEKLHDADVIQVPGGPTGQSAAADSAAADSAAVDSEDAPELEIPPFIPDSTCEVSESKQQEIHNLYHTLDEVDFYELLGLHPGCGSKDVQRAYRKISLKYHPDRFYGKELGTFKPMLEAIFRHMSNVAEYLTDDEQRATYEQEIVVPARTAPSTPSTSETPARESPSRTSTAPSTAEREAARRARKLTREERLRRLGGVLGMTTQELKAVARKRKTPPRDSPATKPPPLSEERLERMSRERKHTTTQRITPLVQRRQKAKLHFDEGVKAMLAGRWAAAASNLKLATTFDPKNAEYREKEQIASERAREDSARSYSKRAMMEGSVGRWDEAARLFKMAAERHPTVEHLYQAADALVKAGDLKVAVEYATRAKDLNPNSVPARLSLASAYLAADMPKNARREVDYALNLDSDNRTAKVLLKEIRRRD